MANTLEQFIAALDALGFANEDAAVNGGDAVDVLCQWMPRLREIAAPEPTKAVRVDYLFDGAGDNTWPGHKIVELAPHDPFWRSSAEQRIRDVVSALRGRNLQITAVSNPLELLRRVLP